MAGTSVTELRKASIALEEAEEIGRAARKERDDRRVGVSAGQALQLAQAQYHRARRSKYERELEEITGGSVEERCVCMRDRAEDTCHPLHHSRSS